MSVFAPKPFVAPFYLKNPHVQSILPKFVRQPMPKYQRQLHLDSTGKTAVAYDFVYAAGAGERLVVLFHGLEGSSQSHYAKTLANYAQTCNVHAVVVHYRGCGGVPNTSDKDYHAGDTAEIHHVLTRLKKLYTHIDAVGVSLGGNMLARYLGEYGKDALCRAAVVVSAPVDLASSAIQMHKPFAKRVYAPYLLNSLCKKAKARVADFPDVYTLDAFDDCYTAVRHGFGSAQNYYQKTSALPVLKNIAYPTLIISAKDDPFLGDVAQSKDVAPCVQLLYSKHGGHVGFVGSHGRTVDLQWLPRTCFAFFDWAQTNT